jgi:hypothetical protein
MLALGSFARSADPPAPKVDPIRLPVAPLPPQPTPPPNPTPVSTLGADQIYVIDSDVPCIVLASPSGIVTVSEDAGPLKIRGNFVDGNGKAESRAYRGKSVFSVEAVGKGRVELLIVPAGGAATDVLRRTLDVGGGPGPQPHPTPEPGPAPPPTALWGFIIVEETAEAVASRGTLLADQALASVIKSKGYHWRIIDAAVVGADGKPPADVVPALNAAKGKTYPQFFVVDAKGNLLAQQNLPDAAGVVAALKKWGN